MAHGPQDAPKPFLEQRRDVLEQRRPARGVPSPGQAPREVLEALQAEVGDLLLILEGWEGETDIRNGGRGKQTSGMKGYGKYEGDK